MAKSSSVLDIIIRTIAEGNGDKRVVSGLEAVKSTAAKVTGAFFALAGTGYTLQQAFNATVTPTVELANQVRGLQQVSGFTAEESSKLIQITDDLKISQESLLKVMQKNGDEFDYSIAGLGKMSDEYLALGSAQEKAEYMQKRFGKSWGDFVELMEQGSGRIIAAGEGINEALIFDQKALDDAREYEKQLDNIKDSWLAIQVAAGREALPIIANGLEAQADFMNSISEMESNGVSSYEAHRRAVMGYTEGLVEATSANEDLAVSAQTSAEATQNLVAAEEAAAEAAKAASEANQTFLSLLGSSQSTYEKFEENNKKLTDERMELEAKKQELLRQGYSEQSQQVQDVNAKLEENKNKTTEVADQFELDNRRIILGYLERQLTADGTLTDAELNWLLEKGVAWGIYSQTVVDETRKAMNEANALINGLITEKTFTLSLNTIYSSYGDTAAVVGQTGKGARRATGTKGWEEVPAGFPNDSYPVWMTSGEQYAVIPAGGNNVSVANGSGGGGSVSVTVNINSMVNTADREKIKTEMLPVILDGIRSAQAQGLMR